MDQTNIRKDFDIISVYAPLFPLISLSGKIPQNTDWQKTPINPALTASDFTGNFGVVLGDKYLVIDVDVKNNQPGRLSFQKLTKDLGLEYGWEAGSFIVKTGTGGFHVYLSKPEGVKISKNLAEYPGIDFLSGNAFVVGAGSVHPDTRVKYLAAVRSPNDVAPAPAALLKKLEKVVIEVQPTSPVVDDDPANVERFIQILKNLPPAVEGVRDTSCYSTACKGRDIGLSRDVCLNTIRLHYNDTKVIPPLEDEALEILIRNAYKYAKNEIGSKNTKDIFSDVSQGAPEQVKWNRSKDGCLQKTMHNAVFGILTMPAVAEAFQFNEFTNMIETAKSCPWEGQRGVVGHNIQDSDIVQLKFYFTQKLFVEFTQPTLWEACLIVSKKRQYHPVQNYLNSLIWDGVPRIDTWLQDHLGANDNIYTRQVSRKVLCAAVKRIFQPGCKWDNVLVLEGEQGCRKSTICQLLGVRDEWFVDTHLDPHNKDSVMNMFGKWVVEVSEMVCATKSDVDALKSFIAKQRDTMRVPYARAATDYPRQSIMIGTVNDDKIGFLKDPTGARRFWVVSTPTTREKPIDTEKFKAAVPQLYAEAMTCYKDEYLDLTGDAIFIHTSEVAKRMPEEPYSHQIKLYIAEHPEAMEIRLSDLLSHMGVPVKNQTRADMVRVASVMADLKWTRDRRSDGMTTETYYTRPMYERILKELDNL